MRKMLPSVNKVLHDVRAMLHQDDYWHGPRRVGPRFVPGRLLGYPNDLRGKTATPPGPASPLGVPLVDFGPAVGHRLHPVTLCQVALGWHDRFLVDGREEHRARFLALADWLLEHQRPWARGGVAWPVDVTYRMYGVLRAPWPSALVQGQAISVLARAATLAPERAERARAAMEGAFVLFETDVQAGGVRATDADGVAFEEYPSATPSLVLNGMISSLWGVADLAIVQGPGGPAERVFRAACEALLRRLPRYDLGFWSRYCLYPYAIPNVASPYYHRAHLAQLQAMALLYPDRRWEEMRARWLRCEESAVRRAAAIGAKGAFRVMERGAAIAASAARGERPRRFEAARPEAVDAAMVAETEARAKEQAGCAASAAS